jgi:uncharacterized protein
LTAVNLKEQILKLLQLQEIDTEIYALTREKEAKPAEIKTLEADLEEKKKQMSELEKTLLNLHKVRKDSELELASKEESMKKLQTQLYSLKTNREYQAMLTEIDGAKADASMIEDKILEVFTQTDKVKADVEKEKMRLKEEEKTFNEQKKNIENRVKEIDDRISQLDAHRRQALIDIDKKILSQYERILNSRDGLAIVEVRDNSCKGCNMHVPAQVINLIKMYQRIVACEVCNRMLCIKE